MSSDNAPPVMKSNEVYIEWVVLVELQDGTRHIGRKRDVRTTVPEVGGWEWHEWVVEPLKIDSVIQDEHGRYIATLGGRVLNIDQFSEMYGEWSWQPTATYGPKLHQPGTAGGEQ